MTNKITADTLHRTAKYFMDDGRAASHLEAMQILAQFGLNIIVGPEIRSSRNHQIALLTLVNAASRTLLSGIRVVGAEGTRLIAPLSPCNELAEAIVEFGGECGLDPHTDWPTALIGDAEAPASVLPAWHLTWSGWRGGVTMTQDAHRLDEYADGGIAPALAAGVCVAEVFAFHAKDHPFAGKRAAGLSLWRPGQDWLCDDESEPVISYAPSNLWLIGLGNLGQAYLWALACLQYEKPSELSLMLQDIDELATSNESTSLLTFSDMIGHKKTRELAQWCEKRGFTCVIEEREFGEWSKRGPHEPSVALCGVDNAHARASLENAGFGLIVETGLGSGPEAFRNLSLHTFPSTLSAAALWRTDTESNASDLLKMSPYNAKKHTHLDECGLTQLASRTVGVPFVGLISACLAIGELLKRLHGGQALELVSLSVMTLEDVECSTIPSTVYEFGHTMLGNVEMNEAARRTHSDDTEFDEFRRF